MTQVSILETQCTLWSVLAMQISQEVRERMGAGSAVYLLLGPRRAARAVPCVRLARHNSAIVYAHLAAAPSQATTQAPIPDFGSVRRRRWLLCAPCTCCVMCRRQCDVPA
jgi:hypothetical protein